MGAHLGENCGTDFDRLPAVDAAALDDHPPGSTRRVMQGDFGLLLANLDGDVLAIADLCLNCSSPLSEGVLRRSLLVCGHCGWRYRLKRGDLAGLPALKLRQIAAWIEGNRILVVDELAPRSV